MMARRSIRLALPPLAGVIAALAGCSQPATEVARTAPPPPLTAPQSTPSASAPTQLTAAEARAAAAATAINPAVGGAAMLGTRTIAENCATAPNLRMLSRAIGLSKAREPLSARAPVTIFAPTDAAFHRLAPGAVNQLLAPANRPALDRVMSYHIVPGTITLEQLRGRINAAGGSVQLPTVAGVPLTATSEGQAIALIDANGSKSYVETPDVQQVNGIVHVVNGVLVPQLG
jgi:uncharacterized surface protein with fasciclin (FAS1) repeats